MTTGPGPRMPLRLLLAVVAGLLCWLAFPGHDQWYAAWLGTALLSYAGWSAGPGRGLVVGLAAGLAYMVPTLSWSGVYVGKLPWFALATLEALYIAAMVAVVAWVQGRLLARGRAWAAYAAVPLGWVVGEWARGATPFGGFPWARLAFSQADAPVAALAAYGGAPLVTAAVATIGVLLHAGAATLWSRGRPVPSPSPSPSPSSSGGWRARRGRRVWSGWTGGAALLGVAAAVAFGPALVVLPTGGPSARVGLVQGNVPRPGLEFNAERRAVLDNHVTVTEDLARRAAGPLDLVVWPENASDIDPLRNPDAAAAIQRAGRAIGAPLLIGSILDEPRPEVSNASLLYRVGSVDPERYVKQHPVPFAEYIPYRDFFRHFSDKVDLVRTGFAKGDRAGAFRLMTDPSRGSLSFVALPTICFEVAYDALMRASLTAAGSTPSLLVVQTNNATFGFTDESVQQFAISRLRAIEHGRSVVHVSTVGVSGFIAPDGSYRHRSALFTPYAAESDVVLRSGATVADHIGGAPEYLAAGGLLSLAGLGRRRRRVDNGPRTASPRSPKELQRA